MRSPQLWLLLRYTHRTHPAASFYPLVNVVREGFTTDVAPTALRGVKAALLQHNLALANHHQRTSTHFCPLEDVVLHSLEHEEVLWFYKISRNLLKVLNKYLRYRSKNIFP